MRLFKCLLLVAFILGCTQGPQEDFQNFGSNAPKQPWPTTTVINNNTYITIVLPDSIKDAKNIKIVFSESVSNNLNIYVYLNGKLITLNTDDVEKCIDDKEVALNWNLDKDSNKEHERDDNNKHNKIKKVIVDDKELDCSFSDKD